MVQPASNVYAFGDGLSHQLLTTLRKRFLGINNDRLKRMLSGLTERQQQCLNVLPLLFHTNHIMMPGYISRQTPCRISDYTPEDSEINLGKIIAKSFTVHFEPNTEESIYGIYVMGSVGTIAQSNKSDLDIWLCYRSDLPAEQKTALAQKSKKIQEWASTLRLEIHFFLMNHEDFKNEYSPELNEESSGSAQKFLLLDEFYRSAIYLAGRIPLWWFVPANEEVNYQSYANKLSAEKFLRESTVLDFGEVASAPEGEFIGAAIWQLYKAIESPYKSVLKLLLLEAYAGSDEALEPLSLAYKKKVYSGETSIDKLDSYVMIYRRIENYLRKKNQPDRLELARRCFYFKVGQALSRPYRSKVKSWQRLAVENFVDEWGWSFEHISMLDKRREWKTNKVVFERSLLVNELNTSYRFLLNYAKSRGVSRKISSNELNILGRKLQAAFERRPGKIEWINPGISSDIAENTIFLSDFYDKYSKTRVWAAFAPEPNAPLKRTPIKSASNLMEILLWAYINKVGNTHSHFDIQEVPSLNQLEIQKIFATFQAWLPLPFENLPQSNFQQTAQPRKALLLLNVGKSPTPGLDGRGMQRLSNNIDAMGYSGFKENLVASVDFIMVNSWNEVHTRRFSGSSALLNTLEEYISLCLPDTHQAPPELTIHCVGSSHSNTISRRVNLWLSSIVQCYYSGKNPPQTRYLFQMAGAWYCLQFIGPKLKIRSFDNEHMLLSYLSEEQAKPSPVVIDAEARLKYPLRLIAKYHKKESITVFYRRLNTGTELYIMDERWSLSHHVIRSRNDFNPLVPLHGFLRTVILRQARLYHEFTSDFGIYPIHFIEIKKDSQQHFVGACKRIPSETAQEHTFSVKAVAYTDNNNKLQFDFYCENQEFATVAFGDQLDIVVAQFILRHRKSGEAYPVYINDLDLALSADKISRTGNLQIGHYLKIKNLLERRLNQAIGILARA